MINIDNIIEEKLRDSEKLKNEADFLKEACDVLRFLYAHHNSQSKCTATPVSQKWHRQLKIKLKKVLDMQYG